MTDLKVCLRKQEMLSFVCINFTGSDMTAFHWAQNICPLLPKGLLAQEIRGVRDQRHINKGNKGPKGL